MHHKRPKDSFSTARRKPLVTARTFMKIQISVLSAAPILAHSLVRSDSVGKLTLCKSRPTC